LQNKGEKFVEVFGILWKIFTTAAAASDNDNVISILDGLDECQESTCNLLLSLWAKSYTQAPPSKPFLKFIVTGRPHLSIKRKFDDVQHIRLKMEDETDSTDRDVKLVIGDRVRAIGKMGRLSDEVQNKLADRLTHNASRTFLWVWLILASIEKSARLNAAALEKLVSNIPKTLDETYEKILEQSSDPEYALTLLHIVVSAERPLSLREMNVAFNIKATDRSDEDLDLESDIQATIRDLCGLFVKGIDQKIYLILQTAKGFLIKPPIEQPQHAIGILGRWKHSLDLSVSNLVMAERCIWYLSFSIFEDRPLGIDAGLEIVLATALLNRYTAVHGFLDYAARYWATHLQAANVGRETALSRCALDLCDTRSFRFRTWFSVHWIYAWFSTDFPQNLTNLTVGGYLGLEVVVRLLLENGVDPDSETTVDSQTALSGLLAAGISGSSSCCSQKVPM
jgi:hypothetical protein